MDLDGEALFEQAACGLLVTNADGLIRRANATFCRWMGYAGSELVGQRRVQDLLTMGGRVFQQTHWGPLLQLQRSVAEVQVDMLHRDGRRIPMLMNVLRQRHGTVMVDVYAVFAAADRRAYERELIVARKNAEAALEARREAEARAQELIGQLSQADRHKDEFLATLAHELRNPLAPMRNVLEVIKQKTRGDASLDKPLDMLERQLGQMTHLVDDLMEVARISQGQLVLRKQPVDLSRILQAAVEDLREMIAAAAHVLHVEMPAQPIVVDADATRLAQIITNLLTNATKYTPPGGQIWLRSEREGEHVLVAVRDTGIGIPPESLVSIFTMFSQLAPALERAQGGLGIGLALVHGLVALHGGSIRATSAGVGLGSEFILRLPLSDQPVAQSDHAVQGNTGGVRRVLVIDDNIDSADSMTELLGLFGFDACCAHNGLDGLQLGRQTLPDVVLLDIGLPDMNGYDIARSIRAEPWGQPVLLIAVTGWGQDKDKQLAIDAGFDRHLTKPVDFVQLEALINAAPVQRPG